MSLDNETTPKPETHPFPAFSGEEKPKPAYSHDAGWEIARIIGYPGAALLTRSRIERVLMAYLDREE